MPNNRATSRFHLGQLARDKLVHVLAVFALLGQLFVQTLTPVWAQGAAAGVDGPVIVLCIRGEFRYVPLEAFESGKPLHDILADEDAANGTTDTPQKKVSICPACFAGPPAVLADVSFSLPAVFVSAPKTDAQPVLPLEAGAAVLPPSRGPPNTA